MLWKCVEKFGGDGKRVLLSAKRRTQFTRFLAL